MVAFVRPGRIEGVENEGVVRRPPWASRGAAGEAGVRDMPDILGEKIRVAMILTGCQDGNFPVRLIDSAMHQWDRLRSDSHATPISHNGWHVKSGRRPGRAE
jgi:hypothetical protein